MNISDEYQYLVKNNLIRRWLFDNEEEAKKFEYQDKILSNVHSHGDKWSRYYSPIGELGVKSIIKAGEYYNSPLIMDAAYDVGKNWADTH